jgi:hypothetical protein
LAVAAVSRLAKRPRDIEHIGSAHDDAEPEQVKAAARQRLAAGQGELDLGLDTAASSVCATAARLGWCSLVITST